MGLNLWEDEGEVTSMNDKPHSDDWLDDDAMSAEETMRRFNSLEPIEVTGPLVQGVVIRGKSVTASTSEGAGIRISRNSSIVLLGNHAVASTIRIS